MLLHPSFPPFVFLILFSMGLFLFYCLCLHYFVDLTYKWYHTLFVFLWLISLSIILSRSIHFAANYRISFFILSTVVHIYHIHIYHFFICSYVDGNLGCFHILADENNTVMNMGAMYHFELVLLFFPDTCTGMELLVNSSSIFINSFLRNLRDCFP